jgi:hypothetical protein
VIKAVGRNQRWSLFQIQCTIKEKAYKLIIDSGSYCNSISKAVVETLSLSIWRIPTVVCWRLHIRYMRHLQLVSILMRWSAMCYQWRYMGYYFEVHDNMIVMICMLDEWIHIYICLRWQTKDIEAYGGW